MNDALYNGLVIVGWVGVQAGMLVVGILTIAAKVWRGWQRFLPLFTVIMAPVSIAIAMVLGYPMISGVFAFLPWLLLGYVIATADTGTMVLQAVPV